MSSLSCAIDSIPQEAYGCLVVDPDDKASRGKMSKKNKILHHSFRETFCIERPWARLRMSRRDYERYRMWRKMGMSREKFESFIRGLPDEAVDLLCDGAQEEQKYGIPATELLKSIFGHIDLEDEGSEEPVTSRKIN